MKISRILCPVDFSETSRHAVAHAILLARWYDAAITALHVYPRLIPMRDLPVTEPPAADAEIRRLTAETADCFRAAAAAGVGVAVIVDAGEPAARILERASALPADVIVMGTHGSSGFQHLLLGSVTEKVLRRSEVPVFTVPPRAAESRLPLERILCAVDFSESSVAALDAASSLALKAGAALIVSHVVEWPWHEPPRPTFDNLPANQAQALEDFRRYMHSTARSRLEALVREDVRARCATTLRVADGKAHVEILRAAEEEHADLIVIGVRGRNAADIALFGSTANQVVRQARCPVLTLRK
jgi:nucleotide-binding universal stress UspA family protein